LPGNLNPEVWKVQKGKTDCVAEILQCFMLGPPPAKGASWVFFFFYLLNLKNKNKRKKTAQC